jgi:hypothetical protein
VGIDPGEILGYLAEAGPGNEDDGLATVFKGIGARLTLEFGVFK